MEVQGFLCEIVLVHIVSLLVLSLIELPIFFIFFFYFNLSYWIALVYLFFFLVDRKTAELGGREQTFIRYLPFWKWVADSLPIRLHKTAPLPPDKNYIIGYHPHGILPIGAYINFCTEGTSISTKFPGITTRLAITHNEFRFPLSRQFYLMHPLISSSKKSIESVLSAETKGNAVVVVIGGSREAMESHPGDIYKIVLKNRKGFIRLALKHGYDSR